MKKIWLLIILLTGSLLFVGCSFNFNINKTDSNEQNDASLSLNDEVGRLLACNERVGFYLNTEEFKSSWDVEEGWWASFILNWHVIREKDWNIAEDDVECIVDMVDKSVNVEFSNHIYNGELQEEPTVSEAPAAKMRVLEWQTEEETMAMVEETCWNMWGEWADWLCNLKDWSQIAF